MAFSKNIALIVCLAALAGSLKITQAGVIVPAAKIESVDAAPQYSFAYDVQDALTGDSKAQYETRNGDVVQGSYSLIEPDGSRRIVDYTADPVNGFNAVVNREPAVAAVAPVVARTVAAVAPPAPVVARTVPAAPVFARTVAAAPAPVFARTVAAAPAPVFARTVAAAPVVPAAAPVFARTVAAAPAPVVQYALPRAVATRVGGVPVVPAAAPQFLPYPTL